MNGQTRSPQAQEERLELNQLRAAIAEVLNVQLQKTKFNPHCKYAHSSDEIRSTGPCYKSTQCRWYAMRKCRNGAQCRFAHGEADCKAPSSSVLIQQNKISKEFQAFAKKKKEKAFQQRRTKENLEIPKPGYTMSITEQFQASHAYLNFLRMQHATPDEGYSMSDSIGLHLPAPWITTPMMPGAGYNLYNLYNAAGNPLHVVSQEAAGPNSALVEALSQHIQQLTATIKNLQDKVTNNMGHGSGCSIYSGTTSAVSGNTSNDDLAPSEVSETSQDLDG
jgi:hypothetical protein